MFHHIEIIILINQEVHTILDTTHLHTENHENNLFHHTDITLVLEITQKTGPDNPCLTHQIAIQTILLHPNQITAHHTTLNPQKDHLIITVPILHILKTIQTSLTIILTY